MRKTGSMILIISNIKCRLDYTNMAVSTICPIREAHKGLFISPDTVATICWQRKEAHIVVSQYNDSLFKQAKIGIMV